MACGETARELTDERNREEEIQGRRDGTTQRK
jgi:hypothetical protein